MIPRVLILNDGGPARGGALAAGLRRRGALSTTAPVATLGFDSGSPSGLSLPGYGGALPDAILVRSISAGSFEAVTRRLGTLHALEHLGVLVWNSAKAIERCVDKSMTTFLLAQAGVPAPPTVAVEGRAAAEAAARGASAEAPLVLKPLFGAQGRGIRMIRGVGDLPSPEEVAGVYYLQRYVARDGPPFRDVRVFVVAGQAVAMMQRCGADWVTNVSRGAAPEPLARETAGGLAELAVAAAQAVGASFAGVDLVIGRDGCPLVLEVNSMPAWSGLQSVVDVDIADALAAGLLAAVAARRAGAELPRPARLVAPANR